MATHMELVECFKDTLQQINKDPFLAECSMAMQAGSRLYLDAFSSVMKNKKSEEVKISVVEDTTFSCASKWVKGGEKTAVLNFANAYSPGGGVKNGAIAQEECLCRSSNLYAGLTIPYMIRHYYKWNQKNTGDMGSDRIIYSPNVSVFKSDDDYPVLLPETERFFVDVITCAAPYYDSRKKKPVSMEKLEQVFYDRIRNILEVAVSNDVDILILGAFGCGAFNNPPELVARTFHRLLVGKEYASCFKNIIFAIKKSGEPCANLEAFRKVFAV